MLGLLLGADEVFLQLCELPSVLHHENTPQPQREVLSSRRDSGGIKPCTPLICILCSLVFLCNALYMVHMFVSELLQITEQYR